MTPSQTLAIAAEHVRAGHLADAEALCRQVLQIDPPSRGIPSPGAIAHSVGRREAAVDFFRQAIALEPRAFDYYSNLSNALCELGRFAEAEAAAPNPGAAAGFPRAPANLANAPEGAAAARRSGGCIPADAGFAAPARPGLEQPGRDAGRP